MHFQSAGAKAGASPNMAAVSKDSITGDFKRRLSKSAHYLTLKEKSIDDSLPYISTTGYISATGYIPTTGRLI